MRSLADTQVLTRALMASFVTSTTCLPRFSQWLDRPGSTTFLWSMLLFPSFVLWAFVFGWHEKYSGRPVFNSKLGPLVWITATLYAIAAAIIGHYLIDPQLRPITPSDFPTDQKTWLAMTLFSLAFEPLFLCFAPFAFFIRLTRKIEAAWAFTVCFGLFILVLRLTAPHTAPPTQLIVELVLLRLVGGSVVVWFYLRGGVWLVWWVGLLLQLRYLFELSVG